MRVVDIGGEPWFVAADVCRALGMRADATNGSFQNHYRRLATDERRSSPPSVLITRGTLISESGLYKLILRSDKPQAKPFQDWVTRVVLPAIRKDGGYIVGEDGRALRGRQNEGRHRILREAARSRPQGHRNVDAAGSGGSIQFWIMPLPSRSQRS
ncbi:BRO-N domain-containing protein [Xanthobacter lutulentifluminis]|uniref:BRO-N domain-containing protein n=1 Tax=Xanthobacter lutulentifluminis TaxID=3119935 RepID=UPI003736514B